jgi:hypothetical protein
MPTQGRICDSLVEASNIYLQCRVCKHSTVENDKYMNRMRTIIDTSTSVASNFVIERTIEKIPTRIAELNTHDGELNKKRTIRSISNDEG